MKVSTATLVASLATVEGTQRRNHLRSGSQLRKLIQKDQARIAALSPRVLSSCDLRSQSDYEVMEPYQHFDTVKQQKEYFSDQLHTANTVQGLNFSPPENVVITSGNGWCDKGVYKSWNKCNINGKCYVDCTDGLCYEQHRTNAERIIVPNGCDTWYRKCAEWCNEEEECVAFSFMDTNVLGHAEYTCNLMKELTCTYGEQNQGDPRTSFHVKGDYLDELFRQYGVSSKEELDTKLKPTPPQINLDFTFGHWSSWGYHSCKRPDGRTCGSGTETRKRTLRTGEQERETRDCDFRNDDGELIECEEIIVEEDVIGHGWMSWGEWTPCSKSCNSNGKRQRSRQCATCSNPDRNGLCTENKLSSKTEADYVAPGGDFDDFCPKAEQIETANCSQGKCLPFTNGNFNGKRFQNKRGWALNPGRNVVNNDNNWLGRCADLGTAYRKVSLAMNNNNNAFGECMRVCQEDERENCLAVSFTPRTGNVHGENLFYGIANDQQFFNCFLFDHRCHENGNTFTDSFRSNPSNQEEHKSWYAFKDLCSGTKICDAWGQYMRARCDSTGQNAFPSQPTCECPGTADHNSGMRLFGRAFGFEFYEESTGKFQMRRRFDDVPDRAPFYSENKYNKDWNRATGGLSYQDAYEQNAIGCHDPCAHNRCMSGSTCVRNLGSPFGYDCVCQWPTSPDPAEYGPGKKATGLAGLEWEQGCKAPDFRNVDTDFKDNMILYGGGWNSQRDPVDKKLVKPYYGYYGLEAMESPWKFKVVEAAQKIPAPDRSAHKGKFYNCMMNIQENEVMVVGGRPGQFFDKWDDKTFVYSWGQNAESIDQDGKWIGTTGERMDETKQGCKAYGDEGCMREHDWPDLPSTPLFECKGQCRDGAAGKGPTDPHWVNEYCIVSGNFWIEGTVQDWRARTFNLCRVELFQSNNGVRIPGKSGKWETREIDDDQFKVNWESYKNAIKMTIKKFRGRLVSDDLGTHGDQHLEQVVNGLLSTGYDRWKMRLNQDMYSPIVGPVDHSDIPQIFNYLSRQNYLPNFMKPANREFHAPGQPICGVMGDRAYIGAGKFARLMSLPVDKSAAAEAKVWHIEPDSQFPEPYKRSNNERCLSPQQWNSNQEPIRFDLMPAYRQNFGTVTTTEGMWMIGGLIAPSADLSGRLLNRKYNVEGCTKQAHLNDVWVFNPRGWSRQTVLGEAAADYDGQSDEAILPTRRGYTIFSNVEDDQNQTFADFRLSDEPGPNGITIDKAIEEGWECTGVQGKWCRKPFLPRNTKGAESVIMCFEPAAGQESVNTFRQGDNRQINRRPRPCTVDETNDPNNDCICYIVNVSGQSGLKQSPGGSGFRPEIDYLEIRRADGTYGSDKPRYQEVVEEFCPDAVEPYPGNDPPFVSGDEAATSDYLDCTTECGGRNQPACNRRWSKRNLRRQWHEAGRIKHPRMGFLAGTLKGEIIVWGGECFGPAQIRQWNLDGTLRMSRSLDQPRSCKIQMKRAPDGSVQTINDDYIEVFSMIRMNDAGYLFGERRYVELEGYHVGQAGHGEAAVSQGYSTMNTNINNFQ